MSTKKNDGSISNMSKTKKLSFFSSILIVIGSSIGAGIFFKSKGVLDNSQSSLVLAIFCWLIAAISIIAMGLSLIEIASVKNDNLSLVGWAKVFNSRITYKSCKNFMFYIYLPLNYFFMPLYVIMSLQDGVGALINPNMNPFKFNTNFDWLIWTLISLCITLYFIFVSGFSTKAGNIQNKIVTYIKFFPLAFVAIMGFVIVGLNKNDSIQVGIQIPPISDLNSGSSIAIVVPGIGMFLAISGIFFAYDGFYVAAGIQTEMKEPKKTPLAILLGLVIVTSIYLTLAISMSINGGSFNDMGQKMKNIMGDAGRILFGLVNIAIGIGILGIINGFSMWTPRFIEELIRKGELPFSYKYKDHLDINKPKIGIFYFLAIAIPIIIIFSLIGSLAYINNYKDTDYGFKMGELYSFADLMGTWTSVFVFGYIGMAIYGSLKNKKSKKNEVVNPKKYFKLIAFTSIVITSISLVATILIPIIDLILISVLDPSNSSFASNVVGRIMLVFTLIIFFSLSYGIIFIENYINIRKFGSIEDYEKWQKKEFESF